MHGKQQDKETRCFATAKLEGRKARPSSPVGRRIAWHPAFYEAIQMDLADYGDALTYEFERQLTAEPLKMDVLIIKKARDVAVRNTIAAIFRGHNIVEYKSPGVSLSVSGFYKVYGYACLYAHLGKVAMQDISVSFMGTKHPRDLLKHLRDVRGYVVTETWPGIYHVTGDILGIQLIERKRLAPGENLWVRHLGDDLDAQGMNEMLTESEQKGKDARVNAYIDVIARANKAILQEVLKMANALTLDQVFEEAGFAQRWEKRGEARGETRGETRGVTIGKHEVARNALREGFSMDAVQRITGLDVNIIRSLR
jgi:hypothetical protein